MFNSATVPALIVPLTGTTPQMLLAEAISAEMAGADILEWRVDFLLGAHQSPSISNIINEFIPQVLAETTLPILITIRSLAQGGQTKVTPGRYRILLAELLDTLLQLNVPAERIGIDLEFPFPSTAELSARAISLGYSVVVSQHDWQETPDNEVMQLLFEEMLEIPDVVVKLAVTANEDADVDRLFTVSEMIAKSSSRPIIALAMGEQGRRSRFEGWKHGSVATFVVVKHSSAPGQPTIAEFRAHIAQQ